MGRTDVAEMTITSLAANLGAEISGLDLKASLSGGAVHAVERAMRDYKVVLFAAQKLFAPELAVFGAHFGELQAHAQKRYQDEAVPEVVWMTNRNAHGSFDEVGAACGSALKTRDGRYSDMAFDPAPAKYTILHALDVPSNGGNTCFANY